MPLPNSAQSIFHAYDVRGIFPTQLNPEAAYYIAHAFFQEVPGERYVVGYDMRRSGEQLLQAFSVAAQELGKTLDSLGECATDMMYFAVGKHGYDGGIMITASHNPREYNGIKMVGKGVSHIDMPHLAEVTKGLELKVPPDLLSRKLIMQSRDYTTDYVEHLFALVPADTIKPTKIVVDAGNGVGGPLFRAIAAKLPQVQVVEMYFEPNDTFPHHGPDPTNPDNLGELAMRVVAEKANLGVGLDGDADRCIFVDEKGQKVPPDFILALLVEHLFVNPNQKVVCDFRYIYAVSHAVQEKGGDIIRSPAGRTGVKEALTVNQALLAGESSGHYYYSHVYNENNSNLTFLFVLQLLSSRAQSLSEAVQYYRNEYFQSGEYNFVLSEGVDINAVFEKLAHGGLGGESSREDGLVIEQEDWRMNARASHTEPKLRINIESTSQIRLDRALLKVHEVMAEFATLESDQQTLPDEVFGGLIRNLWYTWNPHYILPVLDVYGDGWRKTTPPGDFMSHYGKRRLQSVLDGHGWELQQNWRLFQQYMGDAHTWFQEQVVKDRYRALQKLHQQPIAYFSMEYGLVDWLQIYSGGLGVLAGDFMKQASDMGIPMVGVGIFYHQGYFHQDFDKDSMQIETYIRQNPEDFPIELVQDAQGNAIEVEIEIVDHPVWVRAWRLMVGRLQLILMDTNFDRNANADDRMITAHLYGGREDTRIRQEILLGMGGPRILKAMGITPGIYHMNEGHSGFLVFETARRYVEELGLTFKEAVERISQRLVFTNHTLKQAGNDIFEFELMEKYFTTYLDNFRTDMQSVFELGKDDLYAQGKFSMTMLGLRHAKLSNAVSKLHGQAAKKLWPDNELIAITNGVHMPTWVSPEIHRLLDKYVGEGWHDMAQEVDYARVLDIPDIELWQAHSARKQKLIAMLNDVLNTELSPDILTISWARRLTSYKRPDLIMQDAERLASIVNNSERPIQILLAGKAHPQDVAGKEVLQQMCSTFSQEKFWNKVIIVPGYNWQLARRMVTGTDVWMNTPRRYEEASGTSGMKAAANGVLQFTTLDGWTDEVEWEDKGWVIDEKDPSHSIYSLLEKQLAPLYYTKDTEQFNKEWITRMKKSMQVVLEHYSMDRMMRQYLSDLYLPVLLELN